jgi:ABC-2 type transport system permease protein
MNAAKKYWAVAAISAKSNLAYVSEVGSRVVFLAVILYIFMKLWKVTYEHSGAQQLGGLGLNEMLWYLAITESIMMSAPRITMLVDEDVRTGSLAVQLVRPLSYPLYRLFSALGERVVRFVITAAAASLIALMLVGPLPNLGWQNLLFFAVALPLAFILDFLGYFLVGLGAFWMEDTSGPMLIYSRMTMILGGMLIPLQLFPEWAQGPLHVLPFASIVYGPARLFVLPNATEFAQVMTNQSIWIVLFSLMVAAVYSVAVKRISANGG